MVQERLNEPFELPENEILYYGMAIVYADFEYTRECVAFGTRSG